MIQYRIYKTNAAYKFRGWDTAKDVFTIDDYKEVYRGELTGIDQCEEDTCREDKILAYLYRTFNQNHPKDYKASSLSVSDVVEIKREGVTRYYYCDDIGWELLWTEKA